MPDVWEFMRAVRGSSLPASDRLILHTLASLADPSTNVIPDRFTPSLTELARFTGLGRSTVARRLNVIEGDGWLKRDVPPARASWGSKERTRYALLVPVLVSTSPAVGLVDTDMSTPKPAPDGDQSHSGTSPTAGPLNKEEPDMSTSGLVPERDRTSPAAGHVLRTSRTTTTTTTSSPSAKPRKAKKPELHREDVERICTHLADRVQSNGSPRPEIGATWRREARLLLDEKRDPPLTVDKVIALIDWCQDDTFWRCNVRSMPKFRAQYDALRLRALAEYNANRPPSAPGNGLANTNGWQPHSPADHRLAEAMALAQKYAEEDGTPL